MRSGQEEQVNRFAAHSVPRELMQRSAVSIHHMRICWSQDRGGRFIAVNNIRM